jgi:endonuclease YncB( thermonuclease family)
MKRTNVAFKLCALILLLSAVLSCFVACGSKEVDYVSELKLDMTTDSLKQEVTVYKNIDGDTTHFKFKDSAQLPVEAREDGYFKARYMAINTPESTGKIEEWGRRASDFTKNALNSAKSIIIESDDEKWNPDSTGSRFMVWVWYRTSENSDYRNLNLEILQNGLAVGSNAQDNRYGDLCMKAFNQARDLGLYVHSDEEDPDFFYGEAVKMTLKELRLSINDYVATTVAVEGIVTRNDGNNGVYIQSYDEETERYYGVYVYYSANPSYGVKPMLTEGNLVRVVGKISDFDPENPQISGLVYNARDPENEFQMKKLDEGKEIVYTEISADLFVNAKETVSVGDEDKNVRVAELMLGTAVSMKNLKVKSVKPAQSSDALTIYCEVDGIEVQLHAEAMYDEYSQPITEEYYLGKTLDIRGVVDVFYDVYQIEFYQLSDVVFH